MPLRLPKRYLSLIGNCYLNEVSSLKMRKNGMLHEVVIDGIRYVPQAIIQPQDDETLRRAGVSPLLRQLAQGPRRYWSGYRNAFARAE